MKLLACDIGFRKRNIVFQSCCAVNPNSGYQKSIDKNFLNHSGPAESLIEQIECSDIDVTPAEFKVIAQKSGEILQDLYDLADEEFNSINLNIIRIQMQSIFQELSPNTLKTLKKIERHYNSLDETEKEFFKQQLKTEISVSQNYFLDSLKTVEKAKVSELLDKSVRFNELTQAEQKDVLKKLVYFSKGKNKQETVFCGSVDKLACLGVTGFIGMEFALVALYLLSCGHLGTNSNAGTAFVADIIGIMASLISGSFFYAGGKFVSN